MSFAARENLKRTLEYRPHVKASYRGLLVVAGVAAGLVTLVSLMFLITGDSTMAMISLCGGLFAPLILFLEAHFLARPLATAKVHVRADGITLERLGQVIEIHFSDVAAVKFSHIPYVGGWFSLVLQSGKSYRFTVVLERSEYILEAISAVRPGIVRSEDLLAYRRTAIMSDHSWARVYTKAKNWQGLALKYLVLPILLTGVALVVLKGDQDPITFGSSVKVFLLIWGLNLGTGMALTFAVSELVLVVRGKDRLLKNPSDVLRDINFEKKVDSQALIAHWIFAFVVLAIVIVRIKMLG